MAFSWRGENTEELQDAFLHTKMQVVLPLLESSPTSLEDAADINIISPNVISIGNNNVQDILEDQDNHRPFKVK